MLLISAHIRHILRCISGDTKTRGLDNSGLLTQAHQNPHLSYDNGSLLSVFLRTQRGIEELWSIATPTEHPPHGKCSALGLTTENCD